MNTSRVEFREVPATRRVRWRRASLPPWVAPALVAAALAGGFVVGMTFPAILLSFAVLALFVARRTERRVLSALGWVCAALAAYCVVHVVARPATFQDLAIFLLIAGAGGALVRASARRPALWLAVATLTLIASGLLILALGSQAAAVALSVSMALLIGIPALLGLGLLLVVLQPGAVLRLGLRSVPFLLLWLERRPIAVAFIAIYATLALSGWAYHSALELAAAQGPALVHLFPAA